MKEKQILTDQNELNSPTTVRKEVIRNNPFEVKINEVTRVNPFEKVDEILANSSELLAPTTSEEARAVESKLIERDEETRAGASINDDGNRYDDTSLDNFAIDIEDGATEVELGYDITIEKNELTSPEKYKPVVVGKHETSVENFYDDVRADDIRLDEQVHFSYKCTEETVMIDENKESLDIEIEEQIKLAKQNISGSTDVKVEELDVSLNSSEIEEQIKIAKHDIVEYDYPIDLKVNTQSEITEMNSNDIEEQIELARQNLLSFGSESEHNCIRNVELQHDVLNPDSFTAESAKILKLDIDSTVVNIGRENDVSTTDLIVDEENEGKLEKACQHTTSLDSNSVVMNETAKSIGTHVKENTQVQNYGSSSYEYITEDDSTIDNKKEQEETFVEHEGGFIISAETSSIVVNLETKKVGETENEDKSKELAYSEIEQSEAVESEQLNKEQCTKSLQSQLNVMCVPPVEDTQDGEKSDVSDSQYLETETEIANKIIAQELAETNEAKPKELISSEIKQSDGAEQLHIEEHTETIQSKLEAMEEVPQEDTEVDEKMYIVPDNQYQATETEKLNKIITQEMVETSEKKEELQSSEQISDDKALVGSGTNEAQKIVDATKSPGNVISSADYLRSQGKEQKYIDSLALTDLTEEEPAEQAIKDLFCDYDKDATCLFQLIQSKKFDLAIDMLTNPHLDIKVEDNDDHRSIVEQANTWVVRYEADSSTIRWKMLCLHAAIFFKGPRRLIEVLINVAPFTPEARNDQGMLPLHIAFKYHGDIDVIDTVMQAYPSAITCKDYKGRAPLQCFTEPSFDMNTSSIDEVVEKIMKERDFLQSYNANALALEKEAILKDIKVRYQEKLKQLEGVHKQKISGLEFKVKEIEAESLSTRNACYSLISKNETCVITEEKLNQQIFNLQEENRMYTEKNQDSEKLITYLDSEVGRLKSELEEVKTKHDVMEKEYALVDELKHRTLLAEQKSETIEKTNGLLRKTIEDSKANARQIAAERDRWRREAATMKTWKAKSDQFSNINKELQSKLRELTSSYRSISHESQETDQKAQSLTLTNENLNNKLQEIMSKYVKEEEEKIKWKLECDCKDVSLEEKETKLMDTRKELHRVTKEHEDKEMILQHNFSKAQHKLMKEEELNVVLRKTIANFVHHIENNFVEAENRFNEVEEFELVSSLCKKELALVNPDELDKRRDAITLTLEGRILDTEENLKQMIEMKVRRSKVETLGMAKDYIHTSLDQLLAQHEIINYERNLWKIKAEDSIEQQKRMKDEHDLAMSNMNNQGACFKTFIFSFGN